MAKQSGLHQIKGKVGEHSYYRQTGVSAGLIRSINQGLSARVKTDAAFANTRLNNAEFGQAATIAKVVGQMIIPKFRPMMLPFSQGKMAKIILEGIKDASGNWGQRNLTANDVQVVMDALIAVRKNDPSDYGFTVVSDPSTSVISVNTDEVNSAAKLNAIGADGFLINCVACAPWIGTFVPAENKYGKSFARTWVGREEMSSNESVDFNYVFRPAPPQGTPAFRMEYFVVVVMPYRTINNQQHILQEYCTFIPFDPAIEA